LPSANSAASLKCRPAVVKSNEIGEVTITKGKLKRIIGTGYHIFWETVSSLPKLPAEINFRKNSKNF